MNQPNPFTRCLINTFDFFGRASRTEFISMVLVFLCVTYFIAPYIDHALFSKEASYLSKTCSLFFTVPVFSAIIRRLHDAGLSGKWLLTFPTGIGFAIFLPVLLGKGEEEANKYGLPRS